MQAEVLVGVDNDHVAIGVDRYGRASALGLHGACGPRQNRLEFCIRDPPVTCTGKTLSFLGGKSSPAIENRSLTSN